MASWHSDAVGLRKQGANSWGPTLQQSNSLPISCDWAGYGKKETYLALPALISNPATFRFPRYANRALVQDQRQPIWLTIPRNCTPVGTWLAKTIQCWCNHSSPDCPAAWHS